MSSIRLHEHVQTIPRGFFTLQMFRRDKLIYEFAEENLIVDNMKTMMAHLVAGDISNRVITKIGFGTDGTAPVASNNTLTGMYARAIGAVTYPSASSVQFAWQLATGEANGIAILEFGLLSADNSLFARRTRATPINKTSDISLTGTWGLSF